MEINKIKRVIVFVLILGVVFLQSYSYAESMAEIKLDASMHLNSENGKNLIGRKLQLWRVSDKITDENDKISLAKSLESYSTEKLNDRYKKYGASIITNSMSSDGIIKINFEKGGSYYARELLNVGDNRILSSFIINVALDGITTDIKLKLYSPPTTEDYGGYKFLKVANDSAQTPLQGATFKVMKKVGGYYSAVQRGSKEYIVASNSKGEFFVSNLPYGEYYLWETKSPNGYLPLSKSIKFVVNSKSDISDVLKIENKFNSIFNRNNTTEDTSSIESIIIPKTGDVMLILLTVGGAVLCLLGYRLVRDDKQFI
ncbi:SpaA isopeptide-forming pilin-related protein [Peptostreptococcus sp. D1]|uniref:SpaA isopeptide-forming pilin-related protein n=1 Tax=Peptostreptococcus sp. D1 TaxID=72304 RepID=UPI0008E8E1C4|nr:SpaA isopeptide-forming pilin-related protein [Peptostreptococcus sp. D1]SFE15198.1 Cna protein B-type domain-containing protein [Peptostreptococcus sp. D1]